MSSEGNFTTTMQSLKRKAIDEIEAECTRKKTAVRELCKKQTEHIKEAYKNSKYDSVRDKLLNAEIHFSVEVTRAFSTNQPLARFFFTTTRGQTLRLDVGFNDDALKVDACVEDSGEKWIKLHYPYGESNKFGDLLRDLGVARTIDEDDLGQLAVNLVLDVAPPEIVERYQLTGLVPEADGRGNFFLKHDCGRTLSLYAVKPSFNGTVDF